MFTLNNRLESEIEINGKIYPINMAFDNVMSFLEIVSNLTLSDLGRVCGGIYQLLGKVPEMSVTELFKVFHEIMTNFIQAEGKKEIPVDLEGNAMPVKDEKPILDLKHDAPYIFASFKQAYGIDLIEEQGKLDWRKFVIYLRELPDDTRMKQVIGIRAQKIPSGKGMEKEANRVRKLKKIYALPENN